MAAARLSKLAVDARRGAAGTAENRTVPTFGPNLNPRKADYGSPVVMYEDRYPDESDSYRIKTRTTDSAYSVSKVSTIP